VDDGQYGLEIRLLGDLQLLRGGRPLPLPASKKTRALLGYLVATDQAGLAGQGHLRERLCDLLWEGPDDPRAALRWSLTKIRPLLNDPGATRLIASRDRVAFEAAGAQIDVAIIRGLLQSGVAAAATGTLRTAVDQFRGEFLDGLDLPSCYRYHEWCMGEREALGGLRLAALGTLVKRLRDSPLDALGYARAMAAADPLSESAHAAVVSALGALGRSREALDHYDYSRRLLETELAAPLSGELEQARSAVRSPVRTPAGTGSRQVAGPSAGPTSRAITASNRTAGGREGSSTEHPSSDGGLSPLIGRRAEREEIDRIVAAAQRPRPIVLISGEPGIGKSRLLAFLRQRVLQAGGRALEARGVDAEMGRPYGAWIDALRAVPPADVPSGVRDDLALLLPELGPRLPAGTDESTRIRLFDAVAALVQHLAGAQLLALVFDDAHWLDEASASLLHYVLRAGAAPSALLVACAVRPGDLSDNVAIRRVMQSMAREHRLSEVPLGPLDARETAALVHTVDPALDPAAVFAQSEGNPLFVLEVARAHHRGAGRPGGTLDSLLAGQVAGFTPRARDLLVWAAALGRRFRPDLLAGAAGLEAAELLAALGELERHGLLREADADAYEFTHDLIRQAAYRSVSQPRRRLVHRQIARVLATAVAADDALAGELAHHAARAGDHVLAARACAAAGERCLRLFANADAAALAGRGLGHLEQVPVGTDRLKLHLALLKVKILAATGPGLRRLPRVVEELTTAVARARAAGLYAEAAAGFYLLSVLHQEAGDPGLAAESTMRAAAAGRDADQATAAGQLANTARCLAELEDEMGRARALVREAEAIAGRLDLEIAELDWARGLLQRWDGDLDAAAPLVERALALSRQAEDRWREHKCLTWIAIIELERGHLDLARTHCLELAGVAARMGDDDAPFARAVIALIQLAAAGPNGEAELARALALLRKVDDKSHLAYALNAAAQIYLGTGRPEPARTCAQEALAAATAMRRRSEMTVATATLVRVAAGAGDLDTAAACLEGLPREADPDVLSAPARAAIATAAAAAFLGAPTPTPTVPLDTRATPHHHQSGPPLNAKR
jgi:DNA-binding SARP family transcriptional activator/tetratricopeptide (TPR) repeat protein